MHHSANLHVISFYSINQSVWKAMQILTTNGTRLPSRQARILKDSLYSGINFLSEFDSKAWTATFIIVNCLVKFGYGACNE